MVRRAGLIKGFAFLLPFAFCTILPATPGWAAENRGDWRLALPGFVHRFPRDHGAHPAYRTEWWYYSGNLTDGAGKRHAFMLTFFRSGVRPTHSPRPPPRSRWALRDLYFAHFSLLDVSTKRHRYFERFSRGALGEAGAEAGNLSVWLGKWSARGRMEGGRYLQEIFAEAEGVMLRLRLRPRKPPVVHGKDGVDTKGEGRGRASHYSSFTRLAAEGEIAIDGRKAEVRGTAWMDHEFGTNQLAPGQAGWDWVSLQLSDGRDLMLYLIRTDAGARDPHSSGTLVEVDGRAKPFTSADFHFEGTGSWTSPRSGAAYPMGWRIRIPEEGIDLAVRPLAKAQELITEGSTRVTYWEGGVTASGLSSGREVTGEGFVEMTGYAKGKRPKF